MLCIFCSTLIQTYRAGINLIDPLLKLTLRLINQDLAFLLDTIKPKSLYNLSLEFLGCHE
jgi:hypothetical protein